MKTDTVCARIEPELKHEVQLILDKLGLSFSEVIQLFIYQIKLNQGLPFAVKLPHQEKVPNEITAKVLKECEQGINLIKYETPEAIFKDLGIKSD